MLILALGLNSEHERQHIHKLILQIPHSLIICWSPRLGEGYIFLYCLHCFLNNGTLAGLNLFHHFYCPVLPRFLQCFPKDNSACHSSMLKYFIMHFSTSENPNPYPSIPFNPSAAPLFSATSLHVYLFTKTELSFLRFTSLCLFHVYFS